MWEHRSPLRRRYPGVDERLQDGKAHNLGLATARLDGLLIGPHQTFSFNRVVGSCSRRRGYVEGLRLDDGSAVAGVGGGICALSNLVHWLVLHSDLSVIERSEHSVDPFPDEGRVVPWGVGCTIVYNYVDLVVRNDTEHTFQLRCGVTLDELWGELRTDVETTATYRVEARDERFDRVGADTYRSNEIWRMADRAGTTTEELIRRNRARVAYPVPPAGSDPE